MPKFTGLPRDLEAYLGFYNRERALTGRLTNGKTPAVVIHGGLKMQPR